MANVHGLYSNKNDDEDEKDDSNNRYVGGVGDRGGGSGLAVEPNRDDEDANNRDSIFGLALDAGTVDDGEREQIRRTITMYRDGFVVDDGPYRRLDDPANHEFLNALANGRTPRELATGTDGESDGQNAVVGLVDKRTQDYVEEFRSFAGAGESLGTSASATNDDAAEGVFDPEQLTEPPPVNNDLETTSIAVRLLNGKRKIVKIATTHTVAELAAHVRLESEGSSFRLAAGFPPQTLSTKSATIAEAGLKGAQVSMQKT